MKRYPEGRRCLPVSVCPFGEVVKDNIVFDLHVACWVLRCRCRLLSFIIMRIHVIIATAPNQAAVDFSAVALVPKADPRVADIVDNQVDGLVAQPGSEQIQPAPERIGYAAIRGVHDATSCRRSNFRSRER